jgi:hypothetical protein
VFLLHTFRRATRYLTLDADVWDETVFSRNRERLSEARVPNDRPMHIIWRIVFCATRHETLSEEL